MNSRVSPVILVQCTRHSGPVFSPATAALAQAFSCFGAITGSIAGSMASLVPAVVRSLVSAEELVAASLGTSGDSTAKSELEHSKVMASERTNMGRTFSGDKKG